MNIRKNYLASLLALCAFAYAAQADDTTTTNLFGGADAETATTIEAVDGKTDIVLNPNQTNPSSYAYFAGSDKDTISSLATSGSLEQWIITSGATTIDIAAADGGTYTALDNNSSMLLYGGSIVVQNSGDSNATAKLNLGTFQIGAKGGDIDAALEIRTNADITATGLSTGKVISGVSTTLRIANNANVSATLSSDLTINQNGNFIIEKGSTFSSTRNITINNLATLNLAGNLSLGTKSIFLYGNSDISGELETQGELSIQGSAAVSNSAKIAVKKLGLGNYARFLISNNAQIVITNSDPSVELTRATVYLNKKDAIVAADTSKKVQINITDGSKGNYIIANADNEFGLLCVKAGGSSLSLKIADGAHLVFEDIEAQSGITLMLDDFVNGTLFFKSRAGWDEYILNRDNSTVELTDKDGNSFEKTQLHLVDGTYNGESGFWLSTTTEVPEPATCAAFLGIAAAAFIACRRRK